MGKQQRIVKAKRPYRLRARAVEMDRTRQRITQAAIDLHGTIGPAATTMSGVAERAGVTRATLYRHFANEEALFSACSADWLAANPRPDIAGWAGIDDPVLRLRTALHELYAWYRSTEMMRANLLRDIDVLPRAVAAGIVAFPGTLRDALDVGWPETSGGALRRATLGLAVAFDTWRSLAREGLDDDQAASLMVEFVTNPTPPLPQGSPVMQQGHTDRR
jgi:AcrR family transcriptional regulator